MVCIQAAAMTALEMLGPELHQVLHLVALHTIRQFWLPFTVVFLADVGSSKCRDLPQSPD